jgi:hypothetical protein
MATRIASEVWEGSMEVLLGEINIDDWRRMGLLQESLQKLPLILALYNLRIKQ